jgi:hypothetical protein
MANASTFPLPTEQEFWDWAKAVPVPSRDAAFAPITPWGTQRALIRAIFDALHKDIRQVVCLKGGQVGASTVMHLFELFWMERFPGLQGACVVDSDDLREFFRDNLSLMMGEQDYGDQASKDSTKLRRNNKNAILWKNGSRLLFQTAGPRTGRRVGIGRGVAFVIGDEVALWPNPASLTYLRTRVSNIHPARLSTYLSTARGRNWFYDLWLDAADAADMTRVFLAWWMREDYRLAIDTAAFKQFWDGKMTTPEKAWMRELRRRYSVELDPEQWAWRRWYVAEKAGGDDRIADQEEPTLPEDAFEATGQSFLGQDLVVRCRNSLKLAPKPTPYRYEFAARLEMSKVLKTKPALADLLVWEDPKPAEAYVIACVPSYSSATECATAAVSVWKGSLDALVQVAAYSGENVGLQACCWVCVHLLGLYRVKHRAFILEVAGTGMGVLKEFQQLQSTGWGTHIAPDVRKFVGPIHQYIWRRPDTSAGGGAYQWKSSPDLQCWLLRRLKDQIGVGAVVPRDPELVAEFERMRQVDDAFESEGRVNEEHRLMAAALAVESWSTQIRPLFKKVMAQHGDARSVMQRVVGNFFQRIGVA